MLRLVLKLKTAKSGMIRSKPSTIKQETSPYQDPCRTFWWKLGDGVPPLTQLQAKLRINCVSEFCK